MYIYIFFLKIKAVSVLVILVARRLQNGPYFCIFKYARAVKQKVLRATLTPRFTDFSIDFEKRTDCFAV